MKARIQTYEDLLAEKARLKAVLADRAALIKQDVAAIKEELRPLRSVAGIAAKFLSRDKKNPIVNAGIDIAGDLLLRNLLFAKTGFITRWLAPYLLKNLSSNLLGGNGGKLIDSVRGLVARVREKLSGTKTNGLVRTNR